MQPWLQPMQGRTPPLPPWAAWLSHWGSATKARPTATMSRPSKAASASGALRMRPTPATGTSTACFTRRAAATCTPGGTGTGGTTMEGVSYTPPVTEIKSTPAGTSSLAVAAASSGPMPPATWSSPDSLKEMSAWGPSRPAHRLDHLHGEAGPALQVAAVGVLALVGVGGDELVHQVFVAAVNLHPREPRLHGPPGGPGKGLNHGLYLDDGHGPGGGVGGGAAQGAGGHGLAHQPGMGVAPAVNELQDGQAALLLDRRGQLGHSGD